MSGTRTPSSTTLELTKAFVDDLKPTGVRQTYRDTRFTGLILRVGAKGKKSWALDYRDTEGKRQTHTFGTADRFTPGEARKKAKALGVDPAAERREERRQEKASKGRTLKTFLEEAYWDNHLSHRKSGKATQNRISSAWSGLLEKDMADLTPSQAVRIRSGRLKKGIKPQTLNRDRTAILALLNKAVEWRVLEKNPLEDPAFKPLTTEDDKRVRWLGQRDGLEDIKDDKGHKLSERERFMAAVGHAPAYLRNMVHLALNTGLRRGEIFHLKWENVDLRHQQLKVTAATAKANKARFVPLNDGMVALFQELNKVRHISGLVFPNSEGEPFTTIKRSWKTLMVEAQLVDFTFHDLRHDYASRLAQAGVNLYVIKDLLGHSTIQLTERYAHLQPDQKKAAVALLGGVSEG